MLPSKRALLAVAAVVAAVVAEPAADPLITPAPSPTVHHDRRQVAGGSGTPILSTLTYPYTALPSQVYPFAVLRGPQFGYNQCGPANATDSADCQTLVVNNASDFCIWGSPTAEGAIGDVEARVVSYCTNPQWGGRPIPAGSIHGVQFMRTSAYIQWVGFIDNPAISLAWNDTGGELDPHGADLQGNPLGGVVYSLDPAFSEDGVTPGQVHNWNFFVGSDTFCFKACYNNITSPDYCQNIYDLVGCNYNMPNSLQNSTYLACDGDLQTPVGTYTSDGQTLTWSMPDPLTTDPPYTPNIPSSSNCVTYSSEQLFASLEGGSASATATGSGASGAAGATGGAAGTTKATSGGSASGSTASATGSSGARASIALPMGSFAVVLVGIAAGALSLF